LGSSLVAPCSTSGEFTAVTRGCGEPRIKEHFASI